MTASREPTVDELRRESERSRAALAHTVIALREKVSDTADDLKERLSPSHIKEEVKGYVRDGSEQFFHSIERKARENPLQVLAIGAGVAYPLFGLLKSIPVPIMLIGAGLWLSKHKSDAGNGFAQGLTGKVSDAVAEQASSIGGRARDAQAALTSGAERVTDKVRATANDIRDKVVEAGQTVTDTVTDAAAGAADRLSATAADLQTKASNLARQSSTAFQDLIERNPLAVAGAGLALGAFIAASLPPSEAENRMMGPSSDGLKDKALDAVSQGVARAKDAAAGVVDDVAAAASREGLDAQGIGKAVQGLAEGVKSVVDRGVTTALGASAAAPAHTDFHPNKS
jgi:ElaB/YqjD/DUF883 family membrane-anchored ribosome-binding protein